MASKQTYPCYVCKKAGFDDVRVYLDGRTADGKTIYKNEDMTPHNHKQEQISQQTWENTEYGKSVDTSNTNALLKIIIAELQRLIKLFEEKQQQQPQK